eukprot:jgi/Chlat1/5136/Chrsp33S05136
MASFAGAKNAAFDQAARHEYRNMLLSLNAYERHTKFMQDYALFYKGKEALQRDSAPVKTDHDILRETYRFLRTEEDDEDYSWEARLAKRYYKKLYKEYCIADMSRYKEGKLGLRWRVEKELVSGKGQFICGNKACDERRGLQSFELNFAYKEAGEEKNALVKLRLCPKCAYKLHYKKEKELEKQQEREAKKRQRYEEKAAELDGLDEEYQRLKHSKKEAGGGSVKDGARKDSAGSRSKQQDSSAQHRQQQHQQHAGKAHGDASKDAHSPAGDNVDDQALFEGLFL